MTVHGFQLSNFSKINSHVFTKTTKALRDIFHSNLTSQQTSTEPAKGHGERKKLSRAHETASRAHDTASRAHEIKFFSHSHNRALTEKKYISCARDSISCARDIFFFSPCPCELDILRRCRASRVPAAAHSILNFEARVIERNHRKLEIVVLCGQRFERYNVQKIHRQLCAYKFAEILSLSHVACHNPPQLPLA